MLSDMTEAEKGYLAGIIDGEGHLGIWLSASRGVSYPRCAVGMTNFDCLSWCFQKTQLGTFRPRKLAHADRFKKQQYMWRLQNHDEILKLLMFIEPYLIV